MEQNPYDILGVSPAASTAEITKAVAVAMKRKQYPVDVIAKAQKSLMKPQERIIADYLRPLLSPIKRFKYSDLSALVDSPPNLTMLPEFDDLDQALAQAILEESREREPLTLPLSELFNAGVTACQQKRYPKAIKYLENYCHQCIDRQTNTYIQAQMWLIRAYQMGGQLPRAIALCQILVNHSHPQVRTWANKTLPMLSQEMSRV